MTVNQGAGYYSEILAYKAMNICADEIASTILKKFDSQAGPLVIMGQTDLAEVAALWNLLNSKIDNAFDMLELTLTTYPEDYNISSTEKFAGALTAIPAILGSVADIAAFFKTDLTLTSRAVTINEYALISEVAKKIHEKNDKLRIILPRQTVTVEGQVFNKVNILMKKREELMQRKDKLNSKFDKEIKENADELIRWETRKNVQDKIIDKAITDGKNYDNLLKELENMELKINNLSAREQNRTIITTRFDKEIASVDELIKSISEKTAEKPSPLERIAVIDQIKKNPGTKLLFLLTVSQGGEVETSQSTFSQGRVSYIGGAIINYILTESDGTYLCSGNSQKIDKASFKRSKGLIDLNTD